MYEGSLFNGEYPLTRVWELYHKDRPDVTELARFVGESQGYMMKVLAFPLDGENVLDPLATVEGTIPVDSGSFLLSINCFSQRGEGFGFRITDAGSRTPIFARAMGESVNHPPLGYLGDDYSKQGWVLSPMAVLLPGTLAIEITNKSNLANWVQIAMKVAVPISNYSLGVHRMEKGR